MFRTLLAENVSLKDIVPIATTLLETAEDHQGPDAARRRGALHPAPPDRRRLCGQRPELKVFNLTGDLENMLLGALNQARQGGAKVALDNYAIDPNLLSQLQAHMPLARDQMKQQTTPPLLLVMPQVRPLLARYARLFASGLERAVLQRDSREPRNQHHWNGGLSAFSTSAAARNRPGGRAG